MRSSGARWGMIDQTLETVDNDDPLQVLKAIEQYAVECSIIKVWTSEALGYVVDEAVQVYGRLRLFQRLSGGARLPRCTHHAHLRRHE